LGSEILALVEDYSWPGNVRELENVVERALVLGAATGIEARHLPREITRRAPAGTNAGSVDPAELDLPRAVEATERRLIHDALERCGDNKASAARRLRISERTLWYKLKKYGMR